MSGFFDDGLPADPARRDDVSLGPPGGFMDNAAALWWLTRVTRGSNPEGVATDAAREERRKAIEERTGKKFGEAIQPYMGQAALMLAASRERPAAATLWQAQQDNAAELLVSAMRATGQGAGLTTNAEMRARAREIALEAEIQAGDVEARSPGLSATIGRFMGGAGATLRDPVMLGLLPAGVSAGAGILGTMATEGALGAAGTALMLPSEAKWRAELGKAPLTAGEQAGDVALNAAIAAGTGGLVKGAGMGLARLFSARQAVEAFDRAFPDRSAAPPDLAARRDTLETVADLASDNPLPATPAGEAEHLRRFTQVSEALSEGQPLPRFADEAVAGDPYRLYAPGDLKTDAQRFQYKDGGDAAGVTDRLKGVKSWDPSKAGVAVVWENKAGERFVADGHQRLGLAKALEQRGQTPRIMAITLREADGVTAADARMIAAAKNIAEGTGSAIDAAKILRVRPEIGLDLPPASALVRDAQGLARLNDDAFRMVINGHVPESYAALAGRMTADRPQVQAEVLGILARHEPASAIEAESMIRDALAAPEVQATMHDLFGTAEQTQLLFKERAAILSGAARSIKQDKQAFSTLVREQDRLTQAGNILKGDVNAAKVQDDALLLESLQRLARRKGPVADALAQAASDLHGGVSRAVATERFLADVRRAAQGERGLWGAAGGGEPQAFEPRLTEAAPAPAIDPRDMPPPPEVVKAQLDHVPEPSDHARLLAETDLLEAELRQRAAEGRALDVAAATGDEFTTADDLFASLDADKDFLDSVRVCLE